MVKVRSERMSTSMLGPWRTSERFMPKDYMVKGGYE